MSLNKGWSFCIVTVPGNEYILKQSIEKIQNEFFGIENYEILIVGNADASENNIFKNVVFLPFNEEVFSFKIGNLKRFLKEKTFKRLFFRSGAISHKKNLAAKLARFDKLCMMHDYIGLESGWREGYEVFGDDWNVAMNIVLNQDDSRHRDWMAWDHPAICNDSNGSGACLIPYEKYTKYMYISGAYFCVKTEFFLNNLLNEKLFWGEGEDVEWSLRVREKTQFKMNTNSVIKYLKMKPLFDAPNCDSWIQNGKKMQELFGAKDVV